MLSVVAQQLRAIQRGLASRAAEVTIAQHTVPLAPTCGVFVTMNPGYADRAELPDNLQALFRPVTLSAPDSAIVAEAVLFWYGRLCSCPERLLHMQETLCTASPNNKQNHYICTRGFTFARCPDCRGLVSGESLWSPVCDL